ncbi:MAG TPA: flagellar basal body P-ring formation chaperone FlgA [Bryobacteraceae bacterium]
MALPVLLAAVVAEVAPAAPRPDGCFPIQDDRIYARDVAAVIPAFAQVPADFVLGYTPAPGVRRVFKGAALEGLAMNQGVKTEAAPDLCFERAMATLEAGEILEALTSAWHEKHAGTPDVSVELRSWSPQIAPQGTVVFPPYGLQLPTASDAQGETVWRGYVIYGNNRRFGISARARIRTSTTRVVALEDLAAGEPVRQDQVRQETFDAYTQDDRPARRAEDVIGYVPTARIHTGATVLRSQLSRAPEVVRGDVVQVEVAAGGAHLALEGRAESNGVTGATILVKNLVSGKDFRARVTGKGKVNVP